MIKLFKFESRKHKKERMEEENRLFKESFELEKKLRLLDRLRYSIHNLCNKHRVYMDGYQRCRMTQYDSKELRHFYSRLHEMLIEIPEEKNTLQGNVRMKQFMVEKEVQENALLIKKLKEQVAPDNVRAQIEVLIAEKKNNELGLPIDEYLSLQVQQEESLDMGQYDLSW